MRRVARDIAFVAEKETPEKAGGIRREPQTLSDVVRSEDGPAAPASAPAGLPDEQPCLPGPAPGPAEEGISIPADPPASVEPTLEAGEPPAESEPAKPPLPSPQLAS